jgi:hypothetical protein
MGWDGSIMLAVLGDSLFQACRKICPFYIIGQKFNGKEE